MAQKLSTRPAACRLRLWLLTAALCTALPLTAYAREANGPEFTCNPRENRADFDGDCKTDISTFNRGTGYWTTLNSSNNQLVSFQFGQSGDIATPGDYNGDGKTDRAVFRPGDGTWYIATDTTGVFYGVAFGVMRRHPRGPRLRRRQPGGRGRLPPFHRHLVHPQQQ